MSRQTTGKRLNPTDFYATPPWCYENLNIDWSVFSSAHEPCRGDGRIQFFLEEEQNLPCTYSEINEGKCGGWESVWRPGENGNAYVKQGKEKSKSDKQAFEPKIMEYTDKELEVLLVIQTLSLLQCLTQLLQLEWN